MYTFSSKLKTFSFILMVIGLLGIGYGFLNAPKNIEAVEKILAEEHAGHHGGGHHEAAHTEAKHTEAKDAEVKHEEAHKEAEIAKVTEVKDSAEVKKDSAETKIDSTVIKTAEVEAAPIVEVKKEKVVDEAAAHKAHVEHVYHQMKNKPWAALYVACIFIMLISLGVLVFYAIQQVAQAGWSPVLFRVMQGLSSYLPVGAILFLALLILSGMHANHLFPWMNEGILDPKSANYDHLIANKSGYLNFPFWIIRAIVFLAGWSFYQYMSKKNCLLQDEAHDDLYYKKNFKMSAAFLVFFIVTESIMSWDWIMSLDPHWASTLFGWYVFASFFVSGITTIALTTLYLKSKGYLEFVNTSHIHDLAKFMFGISVFWTYLWFSQFMLIWYANIPEESAYFVTRIQDYNLPFFGMIVMNFVFPILILINTDFKRLTWVIVMAGTVILLGHYVDFFNMIMPSTVGTQWFIGIPEIGSLMFFVGLFIFVAFTALSKTPLLVKRNPFIEESKHFHY
jgi:hypothetical protein